MTIGWSARRAAGVKTWPLNSTELIAERLAAFRARADEIQRAEASDRKAVAERKVGGITTTDDYGRLSASEQNQLLRDLGLDIEPELGRDHVLPPDYIGTEERRLRVWRDPTADEGVQTGGDYE
jgi:hypothetical protein